MRLLSTSGEKLHLDRSRGGWPSLAAVALEKKLGQGIPTKDGGGMLAAIVGKDKAAEAWPILEELSMVPPSSTTEDRDLPTLPSSDMPTAALDLLAALLAHKLQYRPGEKDMVILSHQLISVPKSSPHGPPSKISGARTHTSTLLPYGTPSILGGSAMSRTVGLPLAIAALKVLDGKVAERGVKGPSNCGRTIWKGVLDGLEERGIVMKETVQRGVPSCSATSLMWGNHFRSSVGTCILYHI